MEVLLRSLAVHIYMAPVLNTYPRGRQVGMAAWSIALISPSVPQIMLTSPQGQLTVNPHSPCPNRTGTDFCSGEVGHRLRDASLRRGHTGLASACGEKKAGERRTRTLSAGEWCLAQGTFLGRSTLDAVRKRFQHAACDFRCGWYRRRRGRRQKLGSSHVLPTLGARRRYDESHEPERETTSMRARLPDRYGRVHGQPLSFSGTALIMCCVSGKVICRRKGECASDASCRWYICSSRPCCIAYMGEAI